MITVANPDLAIVAAIYSPIMYMMAILPVLVGIKESKKQNLQEASFNIFRKGKALVNSF